MPVAVVLLAIASAVIAVSYVCGKLRLPAPLVLMLVGIGISLLPFVPDLHLDPDVVLIGLLPPLLYAAAMRTSVIDFRANLPSIGYLSIGLVVVTALLIGLLTWWLLPVGFAAAFALGAVVAPPDAVAATAVAKRIGLPRRLVSVLEGESLVNDATAITCLRMGILAMSATVTVWQVGMTFLLALVGGIVIGVVAALVVSGFRRFITSPVLDTSLSYIAPFVAYLPAEAAHSSGVIAVVTTGLILAHRAPVIQDAQSRISERVNWSTIQFLLENSVFFLIGLQANWIFGEAAHSGVSPALAIGYCLIVLAAVIVVRLGWTTLGMRWLLLRGEKRRHGFRIGLVTGWAGMRGVVTLAAALLLPLDTPHRPLLLLAAMVVTAGTLLIHGLTLGPLARRLGVEGPDSRADALAMAAVMEEAGSRALARLERDRPEAEEDAAMDMVRERMANRTNAIWERLGRTVDTEAPSEEYRVLRMASLRYEREEVLRIRVTRHVDHEIIDRILISLDVEESMLAGVEASLDPIEELPLPAPEGELCDELRATPMIVKPHSRECLDCLAEHTRPVHLRLCLTCGNVGCCDSSPGRHADRHFHRTGHPVMRSFEPGEKWRWCYRHRLLG